MGDLCVNCKGAVETPTGGSVAEFITGDPLCRMCNIVLGEVKSYDPRSELILRLILDHLRRPNPATEVLIYEIRNLNITICNLETFLRGRM